MLIVVVAFAVSGFSKAALAVAPANIISYQGRLLNTNGVPVADAALDMQFSFTTDNLGAVCVWSNDDSNCASTANMSVTLTDGLFSVNLGDTGDGFAAIPDAVFADNDTIYLKVVVEGETLLPLKPMVAAPYALNSQTLDGLDSLDFCQGDGTNCVAGSTNWETSAFGTYEDDDDVIVGTNLDETITSIGFSLDGNNLFVAGDAGVEGTVFSDTGFYTEGTVDTNGLILLNGTDIHWDVTTNEITNPNDNVFSFDGADVLLTSNYGLGDSNLSVTQTDGGTLTLGSAITTAGTVILSGTGGINIGDNAVAKIIDIGGVTANGTDTVSISTEGTSADVIAVGNANAATTVAITGGNDWSIDATGNATFAGDVAVNGDDLTSDGTLTIDSSGLVQLGANDDFSTTGDITSTLTGTETIIVNSAPGIDVTADAMTINFAAAHDDTAVNVNYGLHIVQTDSGLAPEYGADALLYLENAAPDGPSVGLLIGGGAFGYGIDLSGLTSGIDFRMNNGETINNITDDLIVFTGVAGGDDTDFRLDLDGTMPIIDSPTDASVSIGDNLLIGATSVVGVKAEFTLSGDDIYAAGSIAAQTNMYADAFVAGDASTTFADGSITATGTALASNIDVTAGALTHTVSLQVDGNAGVSVAATGDGLGGVGIRTVSVGVSGAADSVLIGDANADVSITDVQWSVTNAGAATFSSMTVNGNLDMNNNLVLNVGNAGTDFTAGGGLTLAGALVANTDADFTVDGTENVTVGNAVGTGSNSVDLLTINIINTDAAANNQNGLVIHNMAASSSTTETLITLDNADALAVNAGISITGSGGAVTTGLDVSNANIGTAVSVGDNQISGTTALINFTGFDVLSDGEIQVAAGKGLDTNAVGTLDIGRTNAITLSLCNSAACDSVQIGTNADTDTIQIGDVSDTLSFNSGAGDTTFNLGDDLILSGTGTTEFDLNVSNATTTTGLFNITANSAVATGMAAQAVNLTLNDGAAAGDNFVGESISLTANDADGDMFGLVVQTKGTANAAAGSYENLILLTNSENTVGVVAAGIKLTSTSGVDGDITTGIDVSDANITNAISVGTNTILGTAATIDFSEFDVSSTTGSITIDDGGNAGQILVEGSRWDVDDLTFAGGGTIATTGATTLVLDANAGAAGTIEGSASDSFMLKAAGSPDDVFTDSPAFTLRGTFDSTPGAGVTSTNRDAVITHDITAGGGAPVSQIAFNLIGGANEMTLGDTGNLDFIGGMKAGDTTGNDAFVFTTAIATDAFSITADSVSNGDILDISADGLTGGRGIYIERADGAGNFIGSGLLSLAMLDASSSGKVGVITNSGTGSALFIDQNADTGNAVNATTGGALHIDNTSNANFGLTVYTNQAISNSPLAYFDSANVGFDDYVVSIESNAQSASTTNGTALHVLQNEVDAPGANAVGTQAVVIDTNFNAGAADTALSEAMLIMREDIGGTPDTVFRVDADGDVWADGTLGAGAADVAETYPSTDALVPGEIVAFDPAGTGVLRSTSAYQTNVMGAVSTQPGVLLGFEDAGYHIALTGRVPLFVTDENGAINAGDPIVASSTSGAGMKATEPGMIVGYALEDYSGVGTGSISIFVNPGFYAGNVIGTDGSSTQIADDVEITGSLALRGSSGGGITAAMSVVTDVTDATDYRLSIQNTAGTQVAYVSNEGDLALAGRLYPSDRGAIQTDKYIYYDGSSGMGGDFMRTNASGWATGSYDFAEMFPSDDQLEAGDLVVFGTNNESVARSTSAGSPQLAGIVSTRPGFLAGDNLEDSYPIALAGRVPTKVNLENGAIAVGDPLTSSSTDGYAMKAEDAGVIVGYALEPYAGSAGSDDKIVAFVSVGYWNGNPTSSLPGTNNVASTVVVTQNASNLTSLNMNGNIYMTGNDIVGVSRIAGISDRWSIAADGTVQTEGLVRTAIESHQGETVLTTAVTSPDVQITLTGTATLERGEATVRFEDVSPSFNDVISTTAPIRVIVTPNGPVSLYVSEKNANGFGVRQMDGASDGVTFDWMVTAYRTDYEPEEVVPSNEDASATSAVDPTSEPEPTTDSEPTVEPEPVVDEPVVEDAAAEPTTDVPADPVSPEIRTSDSTESTSVDTEPAPPVLPADDVLSTGT